MVDRRSFTIGVYSSIVSSERPEVFHIEITATSKLLMVRYLQKHRIQLIDHNLITVWKLKSRDDSESHFKITDSLTDRLKEDDLIITPAQLLGEEFYDYYLSFERGIQIKVTVNIDKTKSSSQLLLISSQATANLITKLLHDHVPTIKQSRVILRHKTGLLRGNENLLSLIRNSKSDEFFIDLNRSLQYDKKGKNELLKRLKNEYERRKSDSIENNIEKYNNNLTKTLYHGNHQNHRKLPDIVGTVDMESVHLKQPGSINNIDQFSVDHLRQEIHRRSLPLIPISTQSSSTSQNSFSVFNLNQRQDDKSHISKECPPEPILRTNLLESDQSQSSTASNVSASEYDSVRDEGTCRDSIVIRSNDTSINTSYTNLFEIVKYFNLYSINLIVNSKRPETSIIDFNERIFNDVVSKIAEKPKGPYPVLGSENSAFKTIESSKEPKRSVVLVVDNYDIEFGIDDSCNIHKGDILVDIDGEIVLDKSKDYINQKLGLNNKHNVVIGRLKTDTNNNKEKDKKINKLKGELDILKRKYSDLNHVTIDNDKIIQQLTKVLKKQEISTNQNEDVISNNFF